MISYSAALGIPITLMSMVAAHKAKTPAPPYHPVSDPYDVYVMCSNSPFLVGALGAFLLTKIAMDVNHILVLKYLTPLEKSLGEVVKLSLMWLLTKSMWVVGRNVYGGWPEEGGVIINFAEPWREHSVLMIPAIIIMFYGSEDCS